MERSEIEEYRAFLEGEIRFNDKNASLKYLGKDYRLVREKGDKVPAATVELVQNFLRMYLKE